MNQTEHYGLSQWALTDRVRMADFNADNAKLDAALAALSGLQTSESARLDAAIAAAKTELAANLDTAKTGLETAVSGLSTNKLEQVTLLAKKSFSLSGTSVSVTVPGSEIAKCSVAMAVFTSPGLGVNTFAFYPNNNSSTTHREIDGLASFPGLFHFYPSRTHVALFFPMKGICPYISGIAWSQNVYAFFYSPLKYSALTSLTLKSSNSSDTLSGTATIQIYGLQ